MASPEEIAPLLPETLPEDFGDWDSEASPAPSPGHSGEWEAWEAAHSFGETPKPHWAIRRPRCIPGIPGGQAACFGFSLVRTSPGCTAKDFIDWDSEASPTPMPVTAVEWEAWEALVPSSRLQSRRANPLTAKPSCGPCWTGRAFRVQPRPRQSLLSRKSRRANWWMQSAQPCSARAADQPCDERLPVDAEVAKRRFGAWNAWTHPKSRRN